MRTEIAKPAYRIPIYRFIQAGYYTLRRRPRNLGSDFKYLRRNLPQPPVVEGAQHLPRSGPFVVVANHYERPGLWMGWTGMIMAHALLEHTGRRIRWVAISEWRDYKLWGVPIPPIITKFVFGRFFHTFGFIPMEPQGRSPWARARGVRDAVDAATSGDVIGIFPEGDIGKTSAMIEAQPGSGGLLLVLNKRGAVIIPAGLFESECRLHVSIGPPVDLSACTALPRPSQDETARRSCMTAVAQLVPSQLRGFYATANRESGKAGD